MTHDIFRLVWKHTRSPSAQMGTFSIWHPDVEEFIKAKREDGRLRQFNLSLLIDEMFIKAVENKGEYSLVFPVTQQEIDYGFAPETEWRNLFWEEGYCKEAGYILDGGKILCKVYKKVNAEDLWNTIMKSTYDFAEPGFLLIDEINRMNNNWFCEKIRATNPCGQ